MNCLLQRRSRSASTSFANKKDEPAALPAPSMNNAINDRNAKAKKSMPMHRPKKTSKNRQQQQPLQDGCTSPGTMIVCHQSSKPLSRCALYLANSNLHAARARTQRPIAAAEIITAANKVKIIKNNNSK